jgi:hypothetical protein
VAFGRNAAVWGEPNKAEEGELSSSDKGHSAPSGTVCCPRHETSKNRSQSPTVERLAPVHMVEESIFLPVDPLFRHPARRQEY